MKDLILCNKNVICTLQSFIYRGSEDEIDKKRP